MSILIFWFLHIGLSSAKDLTPVQRHHLDFVDQSILQLTSVPVLKEQTMESLKTNFVRRRRICQKMRTECLVPPVWLEKTLLSSDKENGEVLNLSIEEYLFDVSDLSELKGLLQFAENKKISESAWIVFFDRLFLNQKLGPQFKGAGADIFLEKIEKKITAGPGKEKILSGSFLSNKFSYSKTIPYLKRIFNSQDGTYSDPFMINVINFSLYNLNSAELQEWLVANQQFLDKYIKNEDERFAAICHISRMLMKPTYCYKKYDSLKNKESKMARFQVQLTRLLSGDQFDEKQFRSLLGESSSSGELSKLQFFVHIFLELKEILNKNFTAAAQVVGNIYTTFNHDPDTLFAANLNKIRKGRLEGKNSQVSELIKSTKDKFNVSASDQHRLFILIEELKLQSLENNKVAMTDTLKQIDDLSLPSGVGMLPIFLFQINAFREYLSTGKIEVSSSAENHLYSKDLRHVQKKHN